ncbi:MAG: NAD(P)-dependent oxidoreductase [Candidatus Sericytochromatia bacterium]
MKVFITGTESFVGKELIKQCLEKNIEVFGCDIKSEIYNSFDITNRNIHEIIPDEIDALIHLASLSDNKQCENNDYNCFNINVLGTINIMEACLKKNVKQFIFASSEWVYDSFKENEIKDENSFIDISNHLQEYPLSKLVSEANIRQKYKRGFCDTTILRFGIIYGPREKGGGSAIESVFNSVRTKDIVEIGSLKTGRCFIHVKDIASGIISSIGLKGFNLLNLEGNTLINLEAIIEASKKIFNKNPQIVEKDPNNPSIKNVSNNKAKEVLLWKPQISLEEGLKTLL